MWNLIPKFWEWISTIPQGLPQQLVYLALIWLIIPRLVDVVMVLIDAGKWLMEKFE